MSRKCQWFAVGAGLLTRPPSVDCDARRARRLGAPSHRVSPCGASFFPSDGKETKGSPGETHIAVGAGLGPARPRFMGTAPSGAPPTRTLCHGWSEPGAVVKWCRPKFCAGPGPSGPEGINTWNRILRAGTSAEGYRDNPRKRGSGGGATMGGDAHRSPPPAAFCLLCRRGQRRSPRRAKPCEAARPTDVTAHGGAGGHMGPPLQRLRRITAGRENGRGKPLPYKVPGKYTPAENWRAGRGPAPTLLYRMKPPSGGTSPYTEGRFWFLF